MNFVAGLNSRDEHKAAAGFWLSLHRQHEGVTPKVRDETMEVSFYIKAEQVAGMEEMIRRQKTESNSTNTDLQNIHQLSA